MLTFLPDIERKVKAVIQVAGLHSIVRIDPTNESRRDWFKAVRMTCQILNVHADGYQSNRIYVPASHPVLDDERTKRRLGGQIFTSGENPFDTTPLRLG